MHPALLASWAPHCQHCRPHIAATADHALLSLQTPHGCHCMPRIAATADPAPLVLRTLRCWRCGPCRAGTAGPGTAGLHGWQLISRGHVAAACPPRLRGPVLPKVQAGACRTRLPRGLHSPSAPELQLSLTAQYNRDRRQQLHLCLGEDILKPGDSYDTTWGSQLLNSNLSNVPLTEAPTLPSLVSLQPRPPPNLLLIWPLLAE